VRFLRIPKFPVVVVVIAVASAVSFAQKKKDLPESAYKLIAVIVTGSDHYKSEDVMGATGLQIGQTVNDAELKDATRILGDSGAFDDIAYTFEYSPQGTKVEWRLKDAPNFVPVRFENFVWFSDQALDDAVHSIVPLFHGELPARGRMADQVTEALQALLAQKAVPGSVDLSRVPEDGPIEALVYSVSGVHIEVRNVEFSGAGPEELPLLKDAAEKLQGGEYLRSALRAQLEKAVLPVYLEHGYLKASFSGPEAKIVESHADEILVDATFGVTPGQQYKMTELALKGNRAVPAETLRKLVSISPDQPVNGVEIEKDVTAIKNFYGKHGFVAATVKSGPEIDDAKGTVRYVLTINEGDLYKMGELEIHGLDDHTTSRLQNQWTLRPGDVYDSSYSQRFLAQVYKEIGDWRVRVDETPSQQDHTVDVTLRFDSRAN
jgi:outer membrane protein insertion porin family